MAEKDCDKNHTLLMNTSFQTGM